MRWARGVDVSQLWHRAPTHMRAHARTRTPTCKRRLHTRTPYMCAAHACTGTPTRVHTPAHAPRLHVCARLHMCTRLHTRTPTRTLLLAHACGGWARHSVGWASEDDQRQREENLEASPGNAGLPRCARENSHCLSVSAEGPRKDTQADGCLHSGSCPEDLRHPGPVSLATLAGDGWQRWREAR